MCVVTYSLQTAHCMALASTLNPDSLRALFIMSTINLCYSKCPMASKDTKTSERTLFQSHYCCGRLFGHVCSLLEYYDSCQPASTLQSLMLWSHCKYTNRGQEVRPARGTVHVQGLTCLFVLSSIIIRHSQGNHSQCNYSYMSGNSGA